MTKTTTAAFIGSLAVITWREINNPSPGTPLPLPMPQRYVGAAIVFGILEFMSNIWNEKISDALAAAFFLVLLISTAQNGITKNAGGTSGSSGNSPIGGAVPVNPNYSTPGGGNPLQNPGQLTGPGFIPPNNGGYGNVPYY